MTENQKLMGMTYEQLWKYLHKKYGPVPGDFFWDKKYTKVNPHISRQEEGISIHHIDEDKGDILSDPEVARSKPKSWQSAERLVYANLFEHFLLHEKIYEESLKKNPNKPIGDRVLFRWMIPEFNDMYSGFKYKQPWKQKQTEIILPFKKDYIMVLKHLKDIGFDHPLTGSKNSRWGKWKKDNNQPLYNEFAKNGIILD